MVPRTAMSVALKIVMVAKNKVMVMLNVVREIDDSMRLTIEVDINNSNSLWVDILVIMTLRSNDPIILETVFTMKR